MILEKGVKPILNSRCLQTLSVLWFIFLSGSAPHAVFGASLGDLITLYPYTYTVYTQSNIKYYTFHTHIIHIIIISNMYRGIVTKNDFQVLIW